MRRATSPFLALLLLACTHATAPTSTSTSTSGASTPLVVESEPSEQPPPAEQPPRYPNELPGYEFHADAAWRELVPLESTLADVRRVLGEPSDVRDIANYSAPYPGDDKAEQPVLTYDISPQWDLLVYLVRSDLSVNERYPAALQDKLLSLELVPDHDLPFASDAFAHERWRSSKVLAADAGWTTYEDGSGLAYQVYGSGELNRIVYGASDAEAAAKGVTPK
jgi:hypothetical protein